MNSFILIHTTGLFGCRGHLGESPYNKLEQLFSMKNIKISKKDHYLFKSTENSMHYLFSTV